MSLQGPYIPKPWCHATSIRTDHVLTMLYGLLPTCTPRQQSKQEHTWFDGYHTLEGSITSMLSLYTSCPQC